jgi:signal transduction histidine kinase
MEHVDDLEVLVEEHTVFRRVATLVAQGTPPADVFEAVIPDVARLLSADAAALSRYETDGTLTTLGGWSQADGYFPDGTRQLVARGTLGGLIFATRRTGRVNRYADPAGSLAGSVGGLRWRSAAGSPIEVDGQLWGIVGVASTGHRPLPIDTERRLAEFAELVGTAIANAESRNALAASRARLVASADAARRRIESDLHGVAQQRLVSLALELRAAQEVVPAELGELRAELSRVIDGLTNVLDNVREIAHGIHPAMLAQGGLGPALKSLARRSAIPAELDVRAEAYVPESVEVAAYHVVSEALTNAAKYAHASVVHVAVEAKAQMLCVSVRDDGLGGADPSRGSGLIGLKDRAEAIGGTMSLQSPPSGGTSLHVELPLSGRPCEGSSGARRRDNSVSGVSWFPESPDYVERFAASRNS